MEKYLICEKGTIKKKRLYFTREGTFFLNEESATVGAAVAFFKDCRVGGKIKIGLPLAFQREAEERAANAIHEQYAVKISVKQKKLEELTVKQAEYQEKLATLGRELKALREKIVENEKEHSSISGHLELIEISDARTRKDLPLLIEERDTAISRATAASDAIMAADRLPQDAVFQLLARLSESGNENAA